MGRAFLYVILGGGVAAGYAALEFTKKGVSHGEVCIISDEPVAPYERPALSKGFLFPEAPARLPAFHTCVGANKERLTPEWYKEHGIELILGTRVTSADVRRKTLSTATGETISYKFLIIATGSRALKLEEFGISGSHAENVCYLRDLADATKLVNVMHTCSTGGNAIVIGGGYIGMECAASMVMNKLNVSVVFRGSHCSISTSHEAISVPLLTIPFVGRLFTPKIASYYEEFYKSKGVKFIKGTALSSFVFNSEGKVAGANLKDGHYLPVDMVVVGIGACPNTSLFEGQLAFDKGGIKVNSWLQSSNSSVYAVGDVASFPVKMFGETRRVEHVDTARKSAKHAVSAIMEPSKASEFNYLPFFYSRVFSLSWQFYGDNAGQVVHFGDFSGTSFGAYWVDNGHLVGCFLEGGRKEDYEAIATVVRLKPAISELSELERQGVDFAVAMSRRPPGSPRVGTRCPTLFLKKSFHLRHLIASIVMAASVAALAYWQARMWW